MNTVRAVIFDNTYRDSVELMRIAAELEARDGVTRAGLVMGTAANRGVLAEAGLLIPDIEQAGANDLIVAVAGDADVLDGALEAARAALAGITSGRQTAQADEPPKTIAEALAVEPSAGLVLISTPGAYATAEAMKALKRGLHVFLFSDNVPIEHEVELKALAVRKRRFLMGPDCGTAILDGLPIGFANAVRRGRIGLAAASGTGLQHVACLVDRLGEGISQAIGVGGRDLDTRVGGAMLLRAIDYLASDPATEVLVLLSKPPAPEVASRVLAAAKESGKPVVVNFLGDADIQRDRQCVRVTTLEDAAGWAVALARGQDRPSESVLAPALIADAAHASAQLATGQSRVEGLYSGGTLCKEAMLLLEWSGTAHRLLDLGDDEFTVGRPHPMIDMRLRSERIVAVADDPEVAVLLLDVVLGYGSHPDPAGELSVAIAEAKQRANQAGRGLTVIASVCGTDGDPQGIASQTAKLESSGVLVAPTNAQAARLAALVARPARAEVHA